MNDAQLMYIIRLATGGNKFQSIEWYGENMEVIYSDEGGNYHKIIHTPNGFRTVE